MAGAHRLEPGDLPTGWTIVRSPLDKRATGALDKVTPSVSRPTGWHELSDPHDQVRVLLRIAEPINEAFTDGDTWTAPPEVVAVLVSPVEHEVFPGSGTVTTGVDATRLREIPVETINARMYARWAASGRADALRAELGDTADDKLTRPDGSAPETFYRRVALRYLAHFAETVNPTKAIADEAGVPHSTAAKWVIQARRRNYLPAARERRPS